MFPAAFRRWWIDPGGGRFCRRYWRLVDEALRVVVGRLIERELASGVNGIGLTVMHWSGGIRPMPPMVVILVYQSKKWRQKLLASSMQPKRWGNCGWY